MAFMEQQIRHDEWVEAQLHDGSTEWVSTEALNGGRRFGIDITTMRALGYFTGPVASAHVRFGYGARLSAPGYLDCTDWVVFDTREEAQQYLNEVYPEDDGVEDL